MKHLSCRSLCAVTSFALACALPAQVSDDFYKVFPSRVHTMVKASFDPDDRPSGPSQGNDDGFSGSNGCESYRYDENGTPVSVLAHFEGRPGVLGLFFRNFWSDAYGVPPFVGENNRTRMWVDGVLVHDMPLFYYFRNPDGRLRQIPPFDGPFTGHRSGGHLTHAQIRWQNSFRLALDDDSFSNSARFHRVAATLASPEGELPMPDKARWEEIAAHPGQWPHLYPRNPELRRMHLEANGSRRRLRLNGPATLLELTVRVARPSDWTDLWARFTFDGAGQPQVDVPLRHLGALCEPPASYPVHSLLFDNDGATRITCWFPMPFLSSATLEIENRGPVPTDLRVTTCLAPGVPEEGFGYFVATHDRGITTTGEPFAGPHLRDAHGMLRALILEDFADTSGRIPDMHMTHLEGDMCIRTNGNRGDDHTFAASETSIGRWGWYITPADRPFTSDTSFQSSLMARPLPNGQIEGRRIMGSTYVFDPVHFVDGFEMVLEHGVQNTSNADYALTAFFYVQPGAARKAIDEIDIGNTDPDDPTGEPSHDVTFAGVTTYTQTGHFLRDQFFGSVALTGTVRRVDDHLGFRVRDVDPNLRGVALGFRLDRLGGPNSKPCQADVYVDGRWAGLLHVFTHNSIYPWKEGGECEVELPLALTRGKTSFAVDVRPRSGSDPLRIERIWVYGYSR